MTTTRGVTPEEFKALASLFMSDDRLAEQARQLGHDSWVIAYHKIERTS